MAPNLRLIYCATAISEDWPRRGEPASKMERARYRRKAGQRYAEEIRPGLWMCLCCGKKVKVVA